MTFVDTSAIYAVLDRDDANHRRARSVWLRLVESSQMFTTNYVLVESVTLAQHRLGMNAVHAIQDDIVPILDVAWVDDRLHSMAMTALIAARRRKLSLVDCVSFAIMRQKGAKSAFAFDRHFAEEGFELAAAGLR